MKIFRKHIFGANLVFLNSPYRETSKKARKNYEKNDMRFSSFFVKYFRHISFNCFFGVFELADKCPKFQLKKLKKHEVGGCFLDRFCARMWYAGVRSMARFLIFDAG
jgi:hypothetical protein